MAPCAFAKPDGAACGSEAVVRLLCGHAFCVPCFDTWSADDSVAHDDGCECPECGEETRDDDPEHDMAWSEALAEAGRWERAHPEHRRPRDALRGEGGDE